MVLVVGILALCAVGAIFHLLSEAPTAGELSPATPPSAGVVSIGDLAEAKSTDLAEATPEESTRAEAEAEEPVAEPEIAAEDLVWIEGRVMFSKSTPKDEIIHVLSLDRSHSLPELYSFNASKGRHGPAAAAWDEEAKSSRLLDQVVAEADGSFRIKASKKIGRAHLAISGRYSYSMATRPCALSPEVPAILTAELGAWISGKVTPAPGMDPGSLSGVEVGLGPDITGKINTLTIQNSAFSMLVECDESGNFEFRSLPTYNPLGLVLTHETSAAQIHLGLHPEPGAHLVHNFVLNKGASLAGHVLTESGEALADVKVVARLSGPIGQGVGDLREAKTDSDGAFLLSGVLAGKLELTCDPERYRAGKLKLSKELAEGEARSGLIIEVAKGLEVSGRVNFPDGTTASGISVNVSPDFSKLGMGQLRGAAARDSGSTETDEAGEFTVYGLGEGPFSVMATVDNEEDAVEHPGAWRGILSGVKGGAKGLALEVSGTISLLGRVTDHAGSPLSNFRVVATLKGSGAQFGIGAERAKRDFGARADAEPAPDGVFEVTRLRPGTWEVSASAEGFRTSESIELELPRPEGSELLLFSLEPSCTVTGVVKDSFGQGISGARVSLEQSLADRMKLMGGGSPAVAFSDFEGKFELFDLEPGPCELVALRHGFASSEGVQVELVAGEQLDDVVLELRVGGLLTGEVLDHEGEPAVGRSVIVQRMPSYNRQYMMSSDSRGAFRFEHLEPGDWQVIAMPNVMTGEVDSSDSEGMGSMLGSMEMATATMVDGEPLHLILGKPPEDPITIAGEVRHSGEPVADALVSFVPEGSEGLGDFKMASTDEQGKFELDLDKRGDYLITVQSNVGTGRQNSIEFGERIPAEGDTHHLRFDLPLGRISGHVQDADGDPAANCRVTLNVEGGVAYGSFLGGQYAEITTDEDGQYDIPYLRPGVYTISAGGSVLGGMLGDEGGTSGRVVESGLKIGDGQWLSDIDFKLAKPGVLIGYVKDSAGLPVEGASVWVRDENGRVLERFALVETDGTGKFTYSGLGPGTYRIFAKKGTEVSQPSAPTRLVEGGEAEAVATLDAGTMLLVTVIDKSGAEVRARISVLDGDGNEMSGLLSLSEIMARLSGGFSAKVQRVGPLPAGKYRVSATLDDGRKVHKNLNLGGRAERKVKLRVK